MTNGHERSVPNIVAVKPTNKAGRPGAESGEPRAGAEGNAEQNDTLRPQSREGASHGLERVRKTARAKKKEKFSALLHHITVELLDEAFFDLKKDAAPGVESTGEHIVETFVRASGSGGQNVNKVASAVELRFDARGSRRSRRLPVRHGPGCEPCRVGQNHLRRPSW
jgi:hypothetical protein